jgi:hypothetical protein
MGIRGFFWRVSEFLKVANPSPFNIIAGRDGKLYEIRDHMLGRLVTEKKHVRELEEIKPGFQFQMSKIPGELLEVALSFFRSYCNGEQTEHEVMVQIYFDRLTKGYVIDCPYQRVSKTRIFVDDIPLLHNQRYVQVMQIHSHNTMRSFFSNVDDADEKAFMLYGVVGRLNFYQPDMLLRVGCNGEFLELPLEYIFEKPVLIPTQTPYPEEWDERVKIIA